MLSLQHDICYLLRRKGTQVQWKYVSNLLYVNYLNERYKYRIQSRTETNKTFLNHGDGYKRRYEPVMDSAVIQSSLLLDYSVKKTEKIEKKTPVRPTDGGEAIPRK